MTSKLALVLAVLLAAGCRSDGGIGRADCKQSLDFTLHTFAQRTQADYATTRARLTSLPSTVAHSTAESMTNLTDTYHLYLETHEPH